MLLPLTKEANPCALKIIFTYFENIIKIFGQNNESKRRGHATKQNTYKFYLKNVSL